MVFAPASCLMLTFGSGASRSRLEILPSGSEPLVKILLEHAL